MQVFPGQPLQEKATKNRRERSVALDEFTLSMLRAQVEMLKVRAARLPGATPTGQ